MLMSKSEEFPDIPDFLRVSKRKKGKQRPQQREHATSVHAPEERESAEHAALRAAYGHRLPRGFDSWDFLRQMLSEKQEARVERREERTRRLAEMIPLADLAQRLEISPRDARRALRRDPVTLTPEARRVHRRLPKLARMRHFDPADAADVTLVLREGVAVLREAGSLLAETRKTRGSKTMLEPNAVIVARGKNPKHEGSAAHERWNLLLRCDGKTVAEFLRDRGNPTTLRNAVARGVVQLRQSQQTEERKDDAGAAEKGTRERGRAGSKRLPANEAGSDRGGRERKSEKNKRGSSRGARRKK